MLTKWTAGAALAAAAMGLVPQAPVAAAAPTKSISFRAQWAVSVDADGHAQSLELQSRLTPDLAAALEHEIRSWQFRPGRRDGKPVPTQTTLYLSLSAVPEGKGRSRIHFDRAFTGARFAHLSIPKYPESALAGQREGLALVWARFDADGRVLEAEAAHDAPKIAASLMKSAVAAVKRSTFAPEVVGGQAIAGEAVVPFCFKTAPGAHCKPVKDAAGVVRDSDDVASIDPAVELATDVRQREL
jgi:hypothetical protein